MSAAFDTLKQFSGNWLDRTVTVLDMQLTRYGIGVTDELRRSLQSEMEIASGAEIRLILTFALQGKFRDMGVGRGIPIEMVKQSRERSRGSKRKRMPARWYSKAWYGRLNDLNGAVNVAMQEQATKIIRVAFPEKI